MRKMKKLAAIALIAGIGTAVLTGCASNSGTTTDPIKPGDGGYSETYVQLKDGRTVMCLFRNASSSTATMSCDFEHPIKK